MFNKTKTQKNRFFNKYYHATYFALRCAALCNVVNDVVQFYLRVRENKFRNVMYPKVRFLMIYIFKFYIFGYLHSLVFIFPHVY